MRFLLLFASFIGVLICQELVPSLRETVVHLESVSRITSGLALQKLLFSDKSIKIGDVTKDLLNLKTSEVLEDLKTSLPSLGEVEGLIERIGPEILDRKQFRRDIDTLNDFSEKATELQNAQASSTELDSFKAYFGITGWANSAYLKGLLRETNSMEELLNSLKRVLDLTAEPTETDDIVQLKMAFITMKKKFDSFKKFVEELSEYTTKIPNLVTFGKLEHVGPIEKLLMLRKTAENFDNSRLINITSDFSKLIEDSKNLKEIDTKSSEITAISTQINTISELIEKLQKSENHHQSIGFPRGFSDLSKIFNEDLKSVWILEQLAEKHEITPLKEKLKPLEIFSQKISALGNSYQDFLNATSQESIAILPEISWNLMKSVEISKTIDFTYTTTNNLGDLTECTKELNTAQPEPEVFERFDRIWPVLNELNVEIPKITSFFEDFSTNLKSKLDFSIVDGIVAILTTVKRSMTPAELHQVAKNVQSVPEISNFYDAFEKIMKKIGEIGESRVISHLEFDFNNGSDVKTLLEDVQKILGTSKLVDTAVCLKGKDLGTNIPKILSLLDFGKVWRKIDISPVSTIFSKITDLKGKYDDVGTSSTRRRRRRDLEDVDPEIAKKLALGVSELSEISRIAAKKQEFLITVQLTEEQNQRISDIQIPPMKNYWTEKNRQKIGPIFEMIEKLDTAAGDSILLKNLTQLFEIFGHAQRELTSFDDWDLKFFDFPISSMFLNSDIPEEQSLAGNFREVSRANLNFASYHPDFAVAQGTSKKLRDYFDGIFGINRTISNGNDGNKDSEDLEDDKNEDVNLAEGLEKDKEDEESSMYLIVAIVGVLLFIAIAVGVYCCVIKKKKKPIGKETTELWRHLRFLEEGALLPHEDSHYTPLHLAVVQKNLEDVKKRIKNGAYLNVHSIGKICETPLHTAVGLDLTEFVDILLKNGADPLAMDQLYITAKAKGKGKPVIQKIFRDAENKNYQKIPPKELPFEKYRVFIDSSAQKGGSKEIGDKFHKNMVEKFEDATHFVVKTDDDGVFDLDDHLVRGSAETTTGSSGYLKHIFSPRILMNTKWMSCSTTEFPNDHKYRVKKIKFRGEIYTTLDEIQEDFQKMNVPYLTNASVHFNHGNLHSIDWEDLKTAVTALGATVLDEFPVAQAVLPVGQQHPYYREDMGPLFVIYMKSNEAEINEKHPCTRSEKAYSFMERDEFIAFLLAHKTVNSKLKSDGKTSVETGSVSKENEKESKEQVSKENVDSDAQAGASPSSESTAGKSKEQPAK